MGEVLVIAPTVFAARRTLSVLPDDTVDVAILYGSEISTGAEQLPVRRVVRVDSTGLAPADIGSLLFDDLTRADLVVLDDSQSARDLAGWTAATLGGSVLWGVDAVSRTVAGLEASRPVLGGSHRLVQRIAGTGRVILLAKPTGEGTATGRPRMERGGAPRATSRIQVERGEALIGAGPPSVPLSVAKTVVVVGRGAGAPASLAVFRALAVRLGAALGATRAVVDAGWLPFSHQVGQTGAVVAPALYIGFGVSGAVQHMAGIQRSRRIVAVNTDPTAPLCQRADFVIIDDALTVASALLARLEKSDDATSVAGEMRT